LVDPSSPIDGAAYGGGNQTVPASKALPPGGVPGGEIALVNETLEVAVGDLSPIKANIAQALTGQAVDADRIVLEPMSVKAYRAGSP